MLSKYVYTHIYFMLSDIVSVAVRHILTVRNAQPLPILGEPIAVFKNLSETVFAYFLIWIHILDVFCHKLTQFTRLAREVAYFDIFFLNMTKIGKDR